MTAIRTAKPLPPARVVVLGSRGFVGAAIAAELAAHKIAALPLSSSELDLLGAGAADRLTTTLQPDDSLVIVSALTPDRGKDIATFLKNLRMMEAVCAALSRVKVAHVVNIGSDAVYPDEASLIDETTPISPSGFHGMMHAARETMLRSVYQGPLALLRPTLLYGAADTHNGYGPNRFRRTAAAERRITLFGAGEERRDHMAISDVATLVRRALEERSNGALNLATGRSASFHEVAEIIARPFDGQVEIIKQPRSGGGTPTHRHFATSALLRAFPDFRTLSLEDGIAVMHQESVHA